MYIRDRRSWILFGRSEHREDLGGLECPRLILPYRECWCSSLAHLEGTKKVEYLKGTGLWNEMSNHQRAPHFMVHPILPYPHCTAALVDMVLGFLVDDPNGNMVL